MENFNKNERQLIFNKLKGCISEIDYGDSFSNLVLKVGHENFRYASFCMKTNLFNDLIKDYNIGDKVAVKYYITSNKKNGRWYTTATLLSIQLDDKDI